MQADLFGYELQIGLPPPPVSPYFAFDPEIKQEEAWLGERRSPSNRLLMRRNQAVKVLGIDGDKVDYAPGMLPHESVFGHLAEPERYPELARLRHLLNQWRFYHHFDIAPGSPLRSPQPAIRTPVLSHDGRPLIWLRPLPPSSKLAMPDCCTIFSPVLSPTPASTWGTAKRGSR